MTAPNHPPTLGAVNPLDAGALYAAVFAYVSNALTRMGCPDADRDDIAQRVVVKAYQRRHQYDDTRGTPAQWLWGIARNELRRSEHQRRRGPLLDMPAPAPDVRRDTPSLEDIVLVKDLAGFVWKDVPEAEQRVLWERVMGMSSFDEIAELQGISKSRAQRLYNKGMSRLRAALKRADERKLLGAAVPFAFADLFDLSHGPPVSPDVLERGWQAMLVEISHGDDSPGRCAPALEGGNDEVPPSHPRARPPVLRLVLGPIVGMVAGVLLAGPILSRCDRDHGHDERPVAALAAVPATLVRSAVADGTDPSPAGYLADVANSAGLSFATNTDGAGGETGPADHGPAPRSDARLQDEGSLIDKGRAALASKNAIAAMAAVEQHGRLFPAGRLAVDRESLRAQACAHLLAATHGDAAKIDARCAGKL